MKKVPTGEIQSPALGLLHELGHFVDFALHKKDYLKSQKIGDKIDVSLEHYDNAQEWHNIFFKERPAAERLGEPTRTNHYGNARTVPNSTSREPLPEGAPAPKNPMIRGK